MNARLFDLRIEHAARIMARLSGLEVADTRLGYLSSRNHIALRGEPPYDDDHPVPLRSWLKDWMRALARGDAQNPGIGINKAELYCIAEEEVQPLLVDPIANLTEHDIEGMRRVMGVIAVELAAEVDP